MRLLLKSIFYNRVFCEITIPGIVKNFTEIFPRRGWTFTSVEICILDAEFLFSGLEYQDEIYSASQYAAVKTEQGNNNINYKNTINKSSSTNCVKISSSPVHIVPDIVVVLDDNIDNNKNNKANKPNDAEQEDLQQRSLKRPVSSTAKLFGLVQKDPAERPQTNTSKIFGPRTRDMNKGYLMFSEEAPGQTSECLFFFLILFYSFNFISYGGQFISKNKISSIITNKIDNSDQTNYVSVKGRGKP